jgi:hypothetical protein
MNCVLCITVDASVGIVNIAINAVVKIFTTIIVWLLWRLGSGLCSNVWKNEKFGKKIYKAKTATLIRHGNFISGILNWHHTKNKTMLIFLILGVLCTSGYEYVQLALVRVVDVPISNTSEVFLINDVANAAFVATKASIEIDSVTLMEPQEVIALQDNLGKDAPLRLISDLNVIIGNSKEGNVAIDTPTKALGTSVKCGSGARMGSVISISGDEIMYGGNTSPRAIKIGEGSGMQAVGTNCTNFPCSINIMMTTYGNSSGLLKEIPTQQPFSQSGDRVVALANCIVDFFEVDAIILSKGNRNEFIDIKSKKSINYIIATNRETNFSNISNITDVEYSLSKTFSRTRWANSGFFPVSKTSSHESVKLEIFEQELSKAILTWYTKVFRFPTTWASAEKSNLGGGITMNFVEVKGSKALVQVDISPSVIIFIIIIILVIIGTMSTLLAIMNLSNRVYFLVTQSSITNKLTPQARIDNAMKNNQWSLIGLIRLINPKSYDIEKNTSSEDIFIENCMKIKCEPLLTSFNLYGHITCDMNSQPENWQIVNPLNSAQVNKLKIK